MHVPNRGFVTRYTRAVFLVLMTAVIGLNAVAEESPDSGSTVYVDSENPMRDVQLALDKAKSTGKLLLVVMGAQWCHDSRGLADTFTDPEVAGLLAESYEIVFVDVGYFKDLRAISRRFEQAHYFATPTVMIVNADTERLINAKDMHIWGAADSLPTAKYLEYFAAYANEPSPQFVPIPDVHASAISLFEQTNAQRLTEAYQHLVPAMQLEDKTGSASKAFYRQWREVGRYRRSLQKDIQAIRQQAVQSPDKPLVFPSYDAFSWEDETQP